jgi:hypothetical protein
MGGGGRCVQGFGENTLKERTLGRPRHRWENNIKLDLQEIGQGGVTGLDWNHSGQGQVSGFFEGGDESSGFIKCGEFLD